MEKIKLLIVDDSEVVRSILKEIFSQDKDLVVVGEATNGKEAIEMTKELKPNLITMDIQMPEMDGFEATEEIMAFHPTPILIFSSAIDKSEKYTGIKAISLGALDVLSKPEISETNFFELSGKIINKVKTLSRINVVHHIRGKIKKRKKSTEAKFSEIIGQYKITNLHGYIIVAGISTGGPAALNKFLSGFPKNFPASILIVQHISEGFIDVLVDYLSKNTELRIKVGEDNELIENGTVYFAPDGGHLLIEKNMKLRIDRESPPWNEHKPSINHLFKSAAKNLRNKVIGVIMTGMGFDGSEGIVEIHNNNGITIAQSVDSALISSMPESAISTGKIDYIIDLEEISSFISNKIME